MNRRIAQLWYDALMSEKYKQGEGSLRTKSADPKNRPKYCCLGVLTNICIKDPQIKYNKHWKEDSNSYEFFSGGEAELLPRDLAAELGVDPNPILEIPGGLSNLSTENCTYLNDTMRLDFKQIAACVKETYLKEPEKEPESDDSELRATKQDTPVLPWRIGDV